MPNIEPQALLGEIRRYLDEITLAGDRATDDAEMTDTGSSHFSDLDVYDAMDDAARFVASRVHDAHVPDLIEDYAPFPASESRPVVPVASLPAVLPPFYRLIGESVRVLSSGATARRVTRLTAEQLLKGRGVTPSSTHPTFVYEDAEFTPLAGAASLAGSVVRAPVGYLGAAGGGWALDRSTRTLTLTSPQPATDPWLRGEAHVSTFQPADYPSPVGALVVLSDASGGVLFASTVEAVLSASSVVVAETPYATLSGTGPCKWRLSAARELPDYLGASLRERASASLLLLMGMERRAHVAYSAALSALSGYSSIVAPVQGEPEPEQ